MRPTDLNAVNGNLYELLRERFSIDVDRTFLSQPGQSPLTYRDIELRSARFAAALVERGITPGERLMVQVPKSTDAVALYLACLRVGAVYVPLNPDSAPAEVEFLIDDARPRLFVYSDEPPASAAPTVDAAVLAAQVESAIPLDPIVPRAADDLAAVLYTSGTTGRSKGAMLTHANLASNALTLHAIWRFEPDDVLLHTLPIFHVHGLFVALHTAMLNASEVVFLDRFTVDEVIEQLPRVTVMMGVPTHYNRLLADDRLDADVCRTIRLFTSGSAPMTETVHAAFSARTGHRILERYGMTETGMITSNPYDGDRVAGTVGFALPGVEVRVRNSDGAPCAPGETGIVQVRGPNVFAGYWQLPERSEAAFHGDGFFVTGDVGVLDATGRLALVGRVSDMIISGGLNVYPREIERVIDTIDGVIESAVVGVPDSDLGEIAVAVVATDASSSLTGDAIDSVVAGAVARFKRPHRYVFVDALPRNSMGKVEKAALRRSLLV